MNQSSIDDLGFMISDLNSNPKSEIRNPKFPRRRGITLMEVLISAGVTAVGLFGVIAVVPVAGIQVQRSITEDRKALLGKNAYAELRTRGMLRPEFWVYGNNTAAYNGSVAQAFCIDPRFISINTQFPYSGGVFMPRISFSTAAAPAVALPEHRIWADDIFMSQDDLSYHIPERGDPAPFTGSWRTEPPLQLLTSGNTKRQSDGDFSWFAMLVPKHGTLNDEYVLSVVTVRKRVMAIPASAPATAKEVADIPERTFSVTTFGSGGVNGGEVTLSAPNRINLEGIFQNNWIMLADNTNSLPGYPSIPDFKWYRIIGVDEVLNNSGNVSSLSSPGPAPYRRSVTLQGADWTRAEFGVGTEATIMSGVVGVVERTIKLETSSLWTQ